MGDAAGDALHVPRVYDSYTYMAALRLESIKATKTGMQRSAPAGQLAKDLHIRVIKEGSKKNSSQVLLLFTWIEVKEKIQCILYVHTTQGVSREKE